MRSTVRLQRPVPLTSSGDRPVMANTNLAPKLCDVYYLLCHPTGKGYVGIAAGDRPRARTLRRWRAHKRNATNKEKSDCYNTALSRAIRKHGSESFSVTILCIAFSIADGKSLESEFIAVYETFGPRGYNMTAGGEGSVGFVHSPEAKDRMRQAKLGTIATEITRARMRVAQRGRKHTQGSKDKVRDAKLGTHKSPEEIARRVASFKGFRFSPQSRKLRATIFRNRPTTPKSGFKGVGRTPGNRWSARIKIDGKAVHLGVFDTPELAHAVYLNALRNLE